MGSTYTKSRQAKSRSPKRRFVLEAPSFEGAFLVSATPPIGKPPGAGYVEGRGISSGSVEVLVLDHRVLLRQYRTQHGTLDGDCWDFGVQ